MRAIRCIWHTAAGEWGSAIRSRRALVLLLLYLASAVLCMNGTISVLGKMEKELASILMLPDTGETGVVSASLWKSKPFNRMVRKAVGDSPVFDDISGRHPVELLYAWFAFLCAPILTVLVAGTRISDDLKSGAVRYMLVRETRLEWSLGKFAGQALMLAVALAVSSLGAAVVAFCRLPSGTAASLFLPMLNWALRAWVYSLAWLGLALGISHLTRSPNRATALGILKGSCRKFNSETEKVPHMGWNTVSFSSAHPCFASFREPAWFYFVHSFYVVPDDASVTAGRTDYICGFTSAVSRGNLAATQFHPEKSQENGLKILRGFSALCKGDSQS